MLPSAISLEGFKMTVRDAQANNWQVWQYYVTQSWATTAAAAA
jgi:hypothetical protein